MEIITMTTSELEHKLTSALVKRTQRINLNGTFYPGANCRAGNATRCLDFGDGYTIEYDEEFLLDLDTRTVLKTSRSNLDYNSLYVEFELIDDAGNILGKDERNAFITEHCADLKSVNYNELQNQNPWTLLHIL